jgi:hypothetical protein
VPLNHLGPQPPQPPPPVPPAQHMFPHGPLPPPPLAPPAPMRRAAPLSPAFFLLEELWRWYDQPFGVEVPVQVEGVDVMLFYVPYLSAIHLTVPAPPAALGDRYRPWQTLLSFVEVGDPISRIPLWDKVVELAASCPALMRARSCELHPTSWYSVVWYPISINMHTKQYARGCFLTYHRLQPDLRFVLPVSALPPALSRYVAPVFTAPPLLCGLLPYKVRSDLWYPVERMQQSASRVFAVPLYLMAGIPRLLSTAGIVHHDFNFYSAHLRAPLEDLSLTAPTGALPPGHRRRTSVPSLHSDLMTPPPPTPGSARTAASADEAFDARAARSLSPLGVSASAAAAAAAATAAVAAAGLDPGAFMRGPRPPPSPSRSDRAPHARAMPGLSVTHSRSGGGGGGGGGGGVPHSRPPPASPQRATVGGGGRGESRAASR